MFSSRLHALLLALACSLSVISAPPAFAENPLEKLHKKLFGDDRRDDRTDAERKKDREREKEREKERKREEDRRRDDDHRRHDHRHDDRNYDGRRYEDRRESVVVERRVYVEPAPRTSYYESQPRARYGARSLEAEVQFALRREGFYRGPVDGDIGPGTRAAIRDYQYDRRLPVTGRIDNPLVRSLGL